MSRPEAASSSAGGDLAIYDFLAGPVLVVAPAGELAAATPAAAALLGLPSPLSPPHPADAFGPDAASALGALAALPAGGGCWRREFAIPCGRRLLLRCATLLGEGAEPAVWTVGIGAVGAAGDRQDGSGGASWEGLRIAALQGLTRALAHDLNNALAPIVLSASLLEDGVDLASRPLVADVAASAQQALELVRELQRLARGGEGEPPSVRVRPLLTGWRRLGPEAASRLGLELDPGEESLRVAAEPAELHQLLLNLWLVAAAAVPRGTVVRVRLAPAGPRLRLDLDLAGGAAAPRGAILAPPRLSARRLSDPRFLRLGAAAAAAAALGGTLAVAVAEPPSLPLRLELPVAS